MWETYQNEFHFIQVEYETVAIMKGGEVFVPFGTCIESCID